MSPKKQKIQGKINGMIRIVFVGLLVLGQAALIIFASHWLRQQSSLVVLAMNLLSLIVVLFIISSTMNSSYKVVWIMIIFALPVTGMIFYFAWGRKSIGRVARENDKKAREMVAPLLQLDDGTLERFERACPDYIRISRYMQKSGYPIYENAQSTEFYANGEEFFPAFFENLKKAKKYIFMEFFIIGEGELWDATYEILCQKAKEGVQVRVMYDDVGSLVTLRADFIQDLEKNGIEAVRFNPVNHYFYELYLNYRNHQKIIVIDGIIGMIGGMNLADEYANIYEKHGYWKDTFMITQGPAVRSLLGIFLRMWDMGKSKVSDSYEEYFASKEENYENNLIQGYFQPFAGGPLDEFNPVEDVYKQMVSAAKSYCYVTSPYLVLDDEFVSVLIRSAMSGVDVRIALPKIYDHWYTKIPTHSYFDRLLAKGVKIYEYEPGFVHAKMMVVDDNAAIIGSVNLDFRSFYLHHEAAMWMCDTPYVNTIKQDIMEIMDESEQIIFEKWIKRPLANKAVQKIFGIFAPMI